MIEPSPLLGKGKIVVPVESMGRAAAFERKKPAELRRREIIDARQITEAAECIAPLTRDNELFALTKGRFSLLALIKAILQRTGPAHMSISTWTAAHAEINELAAMLAAGRLLSVRWLVDASMLGRDKGTMHAIVRLFGSESARVTKNHAKFCTFRADGWELVLWSSMNLNMNPRMENFWLGNDPELFGFLTSFLDSVWKGQAFDANGQTKTYIRQFAKNEI